MTGATNGRLIGVGTGPGDPELLTMKALRVLADAEVVAHFAKRGNKSNARATVEGKLRPGVIELPLNYPVTTELDRRSADYCGAIGGFYEASAAAVADHLAAGRSVAVLSEGDPLFYGSYMHLHVRLSGIYTTEVVPGITAMSGCWSSVGVPIVQGDDVLTVLPGTMEEAELTRRLGDCDAAVVMKVGRNLPKIRRALGDSGKLDRAIYVERGTMPDGCAQALRDKADNEAPYFALVLVAGWSARR